MMLIDIDPQLIKLMQFAGTCRAPSNVVNAVRSGTEWPYDANSQVTYTCDSCPSGGGTINCQNNGQWTEKTKCTGGLNQNKYHLVPKMKLDPPCTFNNFGLHFFVFFN